MEQTMIAALAGIGVGLALLIQLLKATPLPTDRPKLIATIIAFLIVVSSSIFQGTFDTSHITTMVTEVGAITVSAIGFYEIVIKSFINR